MNLSKSIDFFKRRENKQGDNQADTMMMEEMEEMEEMKVMKKQKQGFHQETKHKHQKLNDPNLKHRRQR